ncbi:phosphatidylinositol kinase [Puteibacter caeruleilacunae]|nr:phosphatidylinositol kinase [Puteibacter caeruleilacunae]
MRQAIVMYKEEEAGVLTQYDDGSFCFRYSDLWMADNEKPAISPTMPKTQQEVYSKFLFPFFFNMLPEGANKEVACGLLRIDADDYFGLLLAVAKVDTIGAVTVLENKI